MGGTERDSEKRGRPEDDKRHRGGNNEGSHRRTHWRSVVTEGTRWYQAGNVGDRAIVQQGEHLSLNIYPRSDLEELKEYLALAVRDYEARMYAALKMPSTPTHPYKFLYPFGL